VVEVRTGVALGAIRVAPDRPEVRAGAAATSGDRR
jgi:hypothetical protein